MRTHQARAPRCDRLLSVDPLGTPREYCWQAADHPGLCPHPTRGNAVQTTGGITVTATKQTKRGPGRPAVEGSKMGPWIIPEDTATGIQAYQDAYSLSQVDAVRELLDNALAAAGIGTRRSPHRDRLLVDQVLAALRREGLTIVPEAVPIPGRARALSARIAAAMAEGKDAEEGAG